RDQRSFAALRVVDEFVDDEARAWADGEGRAVEQEHLHDARARRVDALVIDDRLADLERARLFAGRLAGGIRRHGGGDADALAGLSRVEGEGRDEQAGQSEGCERRTRQNREKTARG